MKVQKQTDSGSLFDEEICSNPSIYFHGSHRSNLELIIERGILQPEYPSELIHLSEKFKGISLLLSLSHALDTFEYTYRGNKNKVFLSKYCNQAARYVRGVAGERMTTLNISINNLRSLFNDREKLNSEIRKNQYMIQNTYGDDKERFEKKLNAFKNLGNYRALLDEAVIIKEKYPNFLSDFDGNGIVCAIDGSDLEIEDMRSDGFLSSHISPDKIINIVTFETESLPFGCDTCRQKLRSYSPDSQ